MKKYSIGIDLGTTNCVLAYTELGVDEPDIRILPVPQVVAASTVESRDALPSFLYLPTKEESESGIYDLEGNASPSAVTGECARRQSAEVPDRTVAAAKSWLCHGRVDRRAAILPWNAPDDVAKISPIDASRAYLAHLASAWNRAFPDHPLKQQQVVLTVPASFDAGARELTHEAALQAGLPEDLILLEEPQAAVYAWLENQGDGWRKALQEGDQLLVCDVGGGTTDFTLISVSSEDGELVLNRQAVGDHILVGGDNMDLALAHLARNAFAEQGVEVDPWQAVSLWHACRLAKESLLGENAPEVHPVTVLGRGSRVIGGSITAELSRDEAVALLVDGFFPPCEASDRPARSRASGFREIGLPFESDTGITRHLAHFLATHGEHGEAVRPTCVLFNGGALKAQLFRDRILKVVSGWANDGEAPRTLDGNTDLDYAVARGSAYYGHAKQGGGIRIRGGAPKSYYIGIETSGLAVPGAERPVHALCVVPYGMEEGSESNVPGGEIGLVVGEPARFRFYSSTVRRGDQAGDLLRSWTPGELIETDALEAHLPPSADLEDDFVPIRFTSKITELGMFELWSESTISDDRWKLELSVRE